MKDDELKILVEALDGARRSEAPTAHVTVAFDHDMDDNALPYVYDYAEHIGLKVVNVFSTIFPFGKVRREVLFRRPGGVWNGLI